MRIVCETDGYRGGKFFISKDLDTGLIYHGTCGDNELYLIEPIPQLIALDIPIGLSQSGERQCDILDSFVALRTTEMIYYEMSKTIPATPSKDIHGFADGNRIYAK